MILLDTNVLSELMKPAPEPMVIQWLDAQMDNQVFLTAVTKAEIELGIALLPNGKRKDVFTELAVTLFDEFQALRDGLLGTVKSSPIGEGIGGDI